MSAAVIKVAVDGSIGSRRALSWAVTEAGRRGCGVEIVSAYQAEPGQTSDVARAAAESAIVAAMDQVKVGRTELPVLSYRAVEGEPVDVLVRESAHSDLLVMGSHSVEGLRHSALGSVADTCARMANCPVVIVPVMEREKGSAEGQVTAATAPGNGRAAPLHEGRRLPLE